MKKVLEYSYLRDLLQTKKNGRGAITTILVGENILYITFYFF